MTSIQGRPARRYEINPWIPVFLGFAAAELAACVVCGLPAPQAQGISTLALDAVLFITATFAAGALATWLPVRLTGRVPRPPVATLILLAAPGWLLLPAIVLLFRESSPWLLPLAGVAAWLVASGLERLSWLNANVENPTERDRSFVFASVYGLPGPEFHPGYKFVVATAMAATAFFAVEDFVPFASLAFVLTVFLLVWRWRALTDGRHTWRLRNGAALGRFAGLSALVTLLALGLWRAGIAHGPGGPNVAHMQPAPRDGAAASVAGEGYRGIILLPPVEKKRSEISLPVDSSLLAHTAGAHRPLVIRFDGPYWYFKPPNHQPSPDAHLAHGRATDVNVRSTDAYPVVMQAHQILSDEIPLACCSELVVNVTNAEARPGEIALAVVLTDNSTSPEHSVYLGQKTLPGTQLQRASFHPPVDETLRFTIPASTHVGRFNQVDVIFVPSVARSRTGAKIAVNTFTLIPR